MFSARRDMQLSSRKNLPSSEQFYLGGANSVRGYKQDFIGGDKGLIGSLEYALPLDKRRSTMLYGFYDFGTLLGETNYNDHRMDSLGLGVRTSLKKGANSDQRLFMNLSVGFPLKREFDGVKVSKTRINCAMNVQL